MIILTLNLKGSGGYGSETGHSVEKLQQRQQGTAVKKIGFRDEDLSVYRPL